MAVFGDNESDKSNIIPSLKENIIFRENYIIHLFLGIFLFVVSANIKINNPIND